MKQQAFQKLQLGSPMKVAALNHRLSAQTRQPALGGDASEDFRSRRGEGSAWLQASKDRRTLL